MKEKFKYYLIPLVVLFLSLLYIISLSDFLKNTFNDYNSLYCLLQKDISILTQGFIYTFILLFLLFFYFSSFYFFCNRFKKQNINMDNFIKILFFTCFISFIFFIFVFIDSDLIIKLISLIGFYYLIAEKTINKIIQPKEFIFIHLTIIIIFLILII